MIRAGDNPHSNAMAIVWLPHLRVVLQGDLFYAAPLASFPSPSRLPIMKWFAGWLEQQQLAPAQIFGTHDELPATQEHLDKLRLTPLEP